METITAEKARKNFSDLMNRSAFGKERVVVVRHGKSLAAVVPIEDLEVLERIEDRIDIEDARRSLAEPGENVSREEARRILGL